MTYIDLNPVRAGIAETPELSDYTSIQLRIQYWKNKSEKLQNNIPTKTDENIQPKFLMPFAGNSRQPKPDGITYNLSNYLELVDWTGKQIRHDKKQSIDVSTPPILQRIGTAAEHWIELCTHFEERFRGLVRSPHLLKDMIVHLDLPEKPITVIPSYFTADSAFYPAISGTNTC